MKNVQFYFFWFFHCLVAKYSLKVRVNVTMAACSGLSFNQSRVSFMLQCCAVQQLSLVRTRQDVSCLLVTHTLVKVFQRQSKCRSREESTGWQEIQCQNITVRWEWEYGCWTCCCHRLHPHKPIGGDSNTSSSSSSLCSSVALLMANLPRVAACVYCTGV